MAYFVFFKVVDEFYFLICTIKLVEITYLLYVSAMVGYVVLSELSERINTTSVLDKPTPHVPNADTVYLSVVDRDGMACSFINSHIPLELSPTTRVTKSTPRKISLSFCEI